MMHSPLPWKLETGVNFPNTPEPETWVGICAADGTMVLYDTVKATADGDESVRAMLDNASLLVAAPDMLAALKMIDLSDYEIIYAIGTDAVRAILAAVAKAEGRQ